MFSTISFLQESRSDSHDRHSTKSASGDENDFDETEDKFEVVIYAATKDHIRKAETKLSKTAKEEWEHKSINDPQISTLNKYQVSK